MPHTTGLIIVNTGNGKGKTTAALGMALRAWGQGLRVLIIQFIKGGWKYGELAAAEQLGPRFVIRQAGEGFVKNSSQGDKAAHIKAAEEALNMAKTEIVSGQWDLVVLDEINYALHYDLIKLEEVSAMLAAKPQMLHIVLTGRNAAAEIIERAHLVTEMKEIKHPYKQGIKAQKGIEF